MTSKNLDLDSVWLILAAVVGAYVFLFGFLKKINEWYYVIRLGKKKHSSLPPGDMGWPFIGNMISFLRALKSQDANSFIDKLVHRYGKTGIYKTSLFGNPSIIVSSPELCRKILTDDERFEFGYPPSFNKLLGKKSLHGISNSEHRRLRKLLVAPINGHEALSMYIGYIEDIMISSMKEWVRNKSPIGFLTELKKISFNVITKIFMGSTDSFSESMAEHYAHIFQGLFSLLPVDVPGFPFHRALKARKILVNVIQAHLDERRWKKTSNDPNNIQKGMIDLLLEIKDEDGEELENEQIVNLLLGFLFAGHETTAHAALWLTIYLHDHPEILQGVKEEQVEIINRRPPSQKGLTLSEIRRMDYLSKAIDETMRLYGIPLALFRKANNDVEINGYIIPKGWKILVWCKAVHMNSEVYSNPNEFLPSRWDNHKLKAGSFLPFGAGSRTCPGADLSKIEMSIFIHYFLLNYRFERINPTSPIRYPTPSPADNFSRGSRNFLDHQTWMSSYQNKPIIGRDLVYVMNLYLCTRLFILLFLITRVVDHVVLPKELEFE
ncbi:Beta-amyrin 11-oxidase [Hibiscus syriacus]|uniref:Beta-amyrin 11-oxidase n=1 Tax=Hibiscus syriacus TaxID=106335 RepID=A0A6A3D2J1_HIBSY|nr:Beta-amyrin 11-oxidase [Hibiscus syriacus]